jgi:hypothetical protein
MSLLTPPSAASAFEPNHSKANTYCQEPLKPAFRCGGTQVAAEGYFSINVRISIGDSYSRHNSERALGLFT